VGQEELRHRPRRLSAVTAEPGSPARTVVGASLRPGFFRVVTVLVIAAASTLVVLAAPLTADGATKTTKAPKATTTTEPAARTFCEGWSRVRAVRSTGLTGIAVLRVQAERYRALVDLAPKDLRPQVKVMAEYFTTTLAMADKPLNNAKQSAALEALIPKIGDALTAVTRHAVKTCPRSVVLPTTTISPDGAPTTAAPTTTGKK
jgi:hypothetical protein